MQAVDFKNSLPFAIKGYIHPNEFNAQQAVHVKVLVDAKIERIRKVRQYSPGNYFHYVRKEPYEDSETLSLGKYSLALAQRIQDLRIT